MATDQRGHRKQTIRDYLSKPSAGTPKQAVLGLKEIAKPLFELGKIMATSGALNAINESDEDAADFLERHAHGDWGSVFDEDRNENDKALTTGLRIVSAHRTGNGIKMWIVTDAADAAGHRPATTILLPSEW